ncbi:hypothetical protein [Chryseobacterium sp. JM1]|uniref:hypothetical protein n=1 Tax=Chryseobacterium sp. JM1 TaxID=1233950 RepID=UPI0004E74909|nr:hypothetical protein [Chryseobacterium sp. JM1]KFF22915.1 hypothetical protein IW22_01320 [Chryseobacterium sp. JM1]
MNISKIFNETIIYQVLSAGFSIILTVTIIFIKREIERNNRRSFYNGMNNEENILGDIEIKLNEELPRENYFKLITLWSIQPLLLLVLINFNESYNSYFKISLVFSLFIFTILHEFWSGLKYSEKVLYQLLILTCWIISFCILSYDKNISIEKSKSITKIAEYKQNMENTTNAGSSILFATN